MPIRAHAALGRFRGVVSMSRAGLSMRLRMRIAEGRDGAWQQIERLGGLHYGDPASLAEHMTSLRALD